MKFEHFAQALACQAGRPRTFLIALVLILLWAVTGPWFHYNDTWQLIVNTSTTIVTFLMVFVIQTTQNRDNDVLHIKLDELLRSTQAAHNALMNLDELDNRQLKQLLKEYKDIGNDRASDLPEGEPRKAQPQD